MRTAPDLALVRRLPIRHAAEVTEEFIDVNGHMNITQYLRLGAEAVDLVLRSAGMDDDYRDTRRLSNFAVEHHLTYRAEMHLGDRVSAYPQMLARTARAAHLMVYLVDDTNDRLANTMEAVQIHVNMVDRRAVPFPEDVRAALDEVILHHASVVEAPVSGAMGLRR